MDGYDSWGNATVTADTIKYFSEYKISDATYLGNNTWSMKDSKYKPESDIKKFGRNEKGQRILMDLKKGDKYTNIYVHRKDK